MWSWPSPSRTAGQEVRERVGRVPFLKKIKKVLLVFRETGYTGSQTPQIGGIRTMFKIISSYFMLPLLLLLSNSSVNSAAQVQKKGPEQPTATRAEMTVATVLVATR